MIAGAGNETTTRLIGWAGKVLAEHPDQRRELVEDPSLIPNAIEELLRYEPPAPHVGRYAPRDVEHHGQIGARRAARCCSSSDPPTATTAAFPTVTASTSTARSASTSRSGTARTSAWARRSPRLEGRVALEEVLKRFPEWEVDWDGARLAPTSTVRGWETLPVVVP